MLIELTPQQFPTLLPLFSGIENNIIIQSMAEGNNPGRAWADSADHPTTALVWDMQDWLFLAGQAAPHTATQVRVLLADHIFSDARARWIPGMALFYDSPAWQPLITGSILSGWKWEQAELATFNFAGPRIPDPAANTPPGFELTAITSDLLQNTTLQNHDRMRGWIYSFWRNTEEFLRSGFGYCMLSDSSVASWCITVMSAGKRDELGLETASPFRGQGLAAITAAACVNHALANGRQPHWHCWPDNSPSVAVAEKVGFRRTGSIPTYRVNIPS